MMRVVLDTNVLLSGILWKGLPGNIIDHWKEGLFHLVVTDEIFAEYQAVLGRFAGDNEIEIEIDEMIQIVGERAFWCAEVKLTEAVCRDQDDDKFVAAALGGNARFIVSGDKALLEVGSFGGVEILTARQFLSKLRS